MNEKVGVEWLALPNVPCSRRHFDDASGDDDGSSNAEGRPCARLAGAMAAVLLDKAPLPIRSDLFRSDLFRSDPSRSAFR